MQDNDYIQKIVNGESFEELEKRLQGRILELKEAYRLTKYDHAKNLRKDIDGLIKDAKKAVKIPGHEIRLAKELKKYSILINLGKIYGGPENGRIFDRLFEKVQCNDNKLEEKILEPNGKGDHKYNPITKAFKDSKKIKLKHKPYHESFSDYNKLGILINSTDTKLKDAPVRKLEGTFIRKDLQGRLKLLRKNHYQKKILNEGSIVELDEIIEKAKESCMGFEDIANSRDLFLKDVLER
ncbi:MAG: hypothetical protein Q8O03_01290 [Nanoarchaeota archaeon]|nr:hypothetical protein [Nanoarchaeota archaeon]